MTTFRYCLVPCMLFRAVQKFCFRFTCLQMVHRFRSRRFGLLHSFFRGPRRRCWSTTELTFRSSGPPVVASVFGVYLVPSSPQGPQLLSLFFGFAWFHRSS